MKPSTLLPPLWMSSRVSETLIPVVLSATLSGIFSATITVAFLVSFFTFSQQPLQFSPFLVPAAEQSVPVTPSGDKAGSRFLVDNYGVIGPIKWDHLSEAVKADFTLNWKIPVAKWHIQDKVETTTPTWTTKAINQRVALAKAGDPQVDEGWLSSYGPETNAEFFSALSKFPVKGKSVLVVGSREPWVEAFCINNGAASITTVDFNVPNVRDPRLKAISIAELDASDERFDAIFSYSSLEHDGLGRYGDPINPFGDLQRMKKILGLAKPGGLFYLGVPNGNDTLVFNAHRIYGPIRFPMLIKGWELLDSFGEKTLEETYQLEQRKYIQLLHVLKPKA